MAELCQRRVQGSTDPEPNKQCTVLHAVRKGEITRLLTLKDFVDFFLLDNLPMQCYPSYYGQTIGRVLCTGYR